MKTFGAPDSVGKPSTSFLFSVEECNRLLEQTSKRLMITRSHLADYADLEKSTNNEVVKILCELFVSLEGLSNLLKLAQDGPSTYQNGVEHYMIAEESGLILQSLYLPMILELKYRAELYGISLTVN